MAPYINHPITHFQTELFKEIKQKFKNFIIGGDLNSKLIEYGNNKNNSDGLILNNNLETCNCSIVNDKTPTYHEPRQNEEQYKEILDLFICSDNLIKSINHFYVNSESELLIDLKHHCPIELKVSSNHKQTINEKELK